MDVYENLKKLGLSIPPAPPLGGLYVPVKQAGSLIYTSGAGPVVNGKPAITGKLGAAVSIEQGQEAARLCVLNILRALENHIGDLNKIKNIVKVLAFVQSAPGFNSQPTVINGASQLLFDIFGERGRHARSAIGTNELPNDISVEIELIAEV